MSWKFVFNTNLLFLAGQTVGEVNHFVKTTGYKFFTFNGLIYSLDGEKTGITVDDLY